MKKRLFILLFILFSIFVFKVDRVVADGQFEIHYEGCNKAVDDTIDDISKHVTTVNIDPKKPTPTEKCADVGLGWYVRVERSGKKYYYCVDTGDIKENDCGNQGKKIYNNGAKVSNTGDDGDKVYFEWVTEEKAKDQTFTVHFDGGATDATTSNGNSMSDQQIVIGKKTTLNKNQYTRENYKFNGWQGYIVEKDGQKLYMCADKTYQKDPGTCTDFHGGLRIFKDGATVEQIGSVGSTVNLSATWKVFMKGNPACRQFKKESDCKNSDCTWNSKHNFCSNNGLTYLKCGDASDIPEIVPELTGYAVTLLKTVAPIVLIIMSIIQLVKSITAAKEDEIKKAQGTLVKRLIIAVLLFFVVTIVQFVMLKVSDSNEKGNLSSCLSCFLNGSSDSKCGSVYYKDGDGKCYYTGNGATFDCEV